MSFIRCFLPSLVFCFVLFCFVLFFLLDSRSGGSLRKVDQETKAGEQLVCLFVYPVKSISWEQTLIIALPKTTAMDKTEINTSCDGQLVMGWRGGTLTKIKKTSRSIEPRIRVFSCTSLETFVLIYENANKCNELFSKRWKTITHCFAGI